MKILVVSIFVGTLAYLPFYALEHLVTPQLNAIKQTYQAAAQTADAIASNE